MCGKQIEVLEHHADIGAHLAQMGIVGAHQHAAALHMGERPAVHIDHAVIDLLERHQHAQHRGLAGARRADDRDDLVLRNVEIERIKHGQFAVALGDVGEPHDWRTVIQLQWVCGLVHQTSSFYLFIPSARRTHSSNRLRPKAVGREIARKIRPTMV